MRMLIAVTISIAAAATTPLPAFAGEPTSTPTATETPGTATPSTSTIPNATPTIANVRVNVTDTAITWQPVPGADRYTVEATVTAIRINAADICDAPLHQRPPRVVH